MSTDLKRRNVPFSPPDMTEAEANEVRDAILSGWITTGPRTKKLEKEVAAFVGADQAVCLNSQTACGEMALRLLGVGEGDEVIVPAYTYTASASIVEHVGAKLVFVDVQKDCLEMDYEAVEAAITPKTKAIIPVDLLVFLATTTACLPLWSARSLFSFLKRICRRCWAVWPFAAMLPMLSVLRARERWWDRLPISLLSLSTL